MKKLLTILFLMFLCVKLFSQSSNYNPIQTTVPFLTIAPDSRAGAMGDAGVATSPDVYSQHWNPAKFAFIDGNAGLGISYIPLLRNVTTDMNILNLSGYKRIDAKQVISASIIYNSLGSIEITDEFGNPQRTFTPNEFAIDAGYSRLFNAYFSGGIAFRFIYSNLTGGEYDTKPGIAFAADISGYYQNKINLFNKDGQIGVGINFSNIGSKMNYSTSGESNFIPMNMRLGTAVTLNLDKYNKITATLDLNKLLVPTPPIYGGVNNDSIIKGKNPNVSVPVAIFQSFYDAPGGFKEELHEITYSFGIEYWYNNQFAVRGGYFYEDPTKGNRKYFTAGIGAKIKSFTFDFSYLMPTTQNNPLAHTMRFSITWNFNKK
jgi:Type IX secretion system protein PorV